MAKNSAHWTENRVYRALESVFPSPAHVRIPQVRNGTGYQRRTVRTADALVLSVYPSRGLWFAGIEIKVSLSDWKRELADASKAAEIQKWCHYWYVAAPAGVIPQGELPETWGLIECRATSSGDSASVVVKAPRLQAVPPDACFVCSVLRQAAECSVPRAEIEQLAEKRAEEKVRYSNRELDNLRERVDDFRKQTGINIHDRWHYGDISAAVRLIREAGSPQKIDTMAEYLKREAVRIGGLCKQMIESCDEVLAGRKEMPADIAAVVEEEMA
jgi:hypothetical protein